MKKFKFIIKNEVEIHARSAGILVKEDKKYASKIVIGREERWQRQQS